MKYIFFSVIIIVALVYSHSPWDKVLKKAINHNVMIQGSIELEEKVGRTFGSGFQVNDKIWTCWHNIAGMQDILVNHNKQVFLGKVIAETKTMDGLAILDMIDDSLGIKKVDFAEMTALEDYMAMTNLPTMKDIPVMLKAIKHVTYPGHPYTTWLCEGDVTQGMSGSAVWNQNGEIVGMIWGYTIMGTVSWVSVIPIKDILVIQTKRDIQ